MNRTFTAELATGESVRIASKMPDGRGGEVFIDIDGRKYVRDKNRSLCLTPLIAAVEEPVKTVATEPVDLGNAQPTIIAEEVEDDDEDWIDPEDDDEDFEDEDDFEELPPAA